MLSQFFEAPARIRAIRCSPSGALLEDFADYLLDEAKVRRCFSLLEAAQAGPTDLLDLLAAAFHADNLIGFDIGRFV